MKTTMQDEAWLDSKSRRSVHGIRHLKNNFLNYYCLRETDKGWRAFQEFQMNYKSSEKFHFSKKLEGIYLT